MSRRSSIAFPSDSIVLLTRVRTNGKPRPTERLEPPPKKRKNTSKRKANKPRQGSTADRNENDLDVSASSPAPSAPDLHNDSDGVEHHSSPSHGGSSEKSGDQHNHCHCEDKLLDELEKLDPDWKKECQANAVLQQELEKEKKRVDFCLDRFKDDNSKIRFYTGFTTFGMLIACYNFFAALCKEHANLAREENISW